MPHIKNTISLILLLASLIVSAQEQIKSYEISAQNGISNANCSIQDSEGVIWVGTWGGLHKFDGREVTSVGNGTKEGASLSSQTIADIKEQGKGILWVLTHFGINRIDVQTGEIKQYFPRLGEDWDYLASSIDISKNGLLLCSLTDRVSYYDEDEDTIKKIPLTNYSGEDIRSIAWLDDDEFVLRNSEDEVFLGMIQFENKKPRNATLTKQDKAKGALHLKTSRGNIYLIYENRIIQVSSDKKYIVAELPAQGISDVSCRDDGLLAVCNYNQVWTIDLETKETNLWHKTVEHITGINWGGQGILWICSETGLSATFRNTRKFESISNTDRERIGEIWCLGEDENGIIYVGSKNGLFYINDGMIENVNDLTGKVRNKGVKCITRLDDGRYAISSSSSVSVVQLKKGVIAQADVIEPADPYVFGICNGKEKGEIWTASFVNGLVKHKYLSYPDGIELRESKNITPGLARNGISGRVGQGVEYDSKKDIIWYGSHLGGLFALNENTEVFRTVPITDIHSNICIDAAIVKYNTDSSSLYCGTSVGLREIKRNRDGNYEMYRIPELEGSLLDYHYTSALVFDKNSNLWANSASRLIKYDIRSKKTTTFDIDEYISYGSIARLAAICASDGTLYFGGNTGLMWFDPATIKATSYSPKVCLTSFMVKNTAKEDFRKDRILRLQHSDNYFTIKFNAIDYINNKKCTYSYMLHGFDKAWNEIGDRHEATFTNVPPGKYIFRVKCSNGENSIMENVTELPITILRPWWSSSLAIILYIITILSTAFWAYISAKRRYREKREMEMVEIRQRQEEEKFEAKLDFFTNVAHEFGTPLTLISGSAGQLKEDKRLPYDVQNTISIIQNNSKRLQKLIQELLNFRKASTGKYVPHYSSFNLSSLLSDIAGNFKEKAQSKHIVFGLSLPKKACIVTSDYDALEKILYNLISNAFKYTDNDGRIEAVLKLENGIDFSISNTGTGIAEEDLPKVFDRFEILDNFEKKASSDGGGRNGIGLALVKSLIDALDGTISVSSEKDKCTLFSFHLPKVNISEIQEDTDENEEDNNTADVPHISLEKPTILVVDDEKQIRELITSILKDSYNVIPAKNGLDALDKLRMIHANLIITDKIMPRMDGIEFIEKLKGSELLRHIPIIAMSFKTEEGDETVFYQMGVENFVQKPFNPTTFKALVSKTLNTRSELKSYYNSSASNDQLFTGKVVSSEDKSFILKAIQIIEQNIANEDLSPGFIAERMNVSDIKLYRKIKELFQMTSVEFIRYIKLNYAASLLKTSTLTIQEVMYSSGFNNRSYFHKKFAEAYGATPSVYREQNKD